MFFRRLILGSAVVAAVCSLEILLDDAGKHIRPGAAWTKAEGDCAQAGHGGGFHHNNGIHNGETFATWNFSIATDGCYWVEEFHPDTSSCDFSLASRVPVHIHFCRGLQTAGLIDQSKRAGQWNKLVRLPFYTTHTAAIHISAMGMDVQAAGVWAADAFRLTWHSESCHDEEAESDEAVAPTDDKAVAPTGEDKAVAPTGEDKAADTVPHTLQYTVKSSITFDFEWEAISENIVNDQGFRSNVASSIAVALGVKSKVAADATSLPSSHVKVKKIQIVKSRRLAERRLASLKLKVDFELYTTDQGELEGFKSAMTEPTAFMRTFETQLVAREQGPRREVQVTVTQVEPASVVETKGKAKVEHEAAEAKPPSDPLSSTEESGAATIEDGTQEKDIKALEKAVEEEPKLALLQALVDDAYTKVLGSTLEPVSQCPATSSRTFHHDALQKDRRAQATFQFDPPRDGCYLIEERHPQLEQCKASAATKVNVNYCKGRKALGTVDQNTNAGQWTFIGALPFFAGHPGDVTLSNEGTEPGTLTVFDQVRFTWSGKSCSQADSHPRKAEIRFTVDFETVKNRQTEFGSVLKSQLAKLAGVPERALRLTGLRSGSIIASFLVFPSAVDEPLAAPFSASQTIEKLRDAVAKNADDLCALTGSSQSCEVQLTDLGRAQPSIRPVPTDRLRPLRTVEETRDEGEIGEGIMWVLVAGALFLIFMALPLVYFAFKRLKPKADKVPSPVTTGKAAENLEASSMEEGKAIDEKKEDVNDNASTLAPSSDKQSEPSVSGDIEDDLKSNLSVVKALSEQDI